MGRFLTSIIAAALLCAAASQARAQDEVDRLDMKGHKAFDAQDYDLAIKCWSAVIKLEPGDSTAWFNRATAYSSKGDTDSALSDYNESIRLNPSDSDARKSRGELYIVKYNAATAKGAETADAAAAIADYNELVRLKPGIDSLLERGDAALQTGGYDQAITDFTAITKLDPKNAQAFESIASAYLSKGDRARAADAITSIIALDSNDQASYTMRGNIYLQNGNYDKAMADADQSLRMNSNNPDALALHANTNAAMGNYDKALDELNTLMTASPDYSEAFNAAAWLYATCPKDSVRNGAKAIDLATKACELTGWRDDGLIDTLAAAEAESGKWDDAIKYQKQAIDLGRANKETPIALKDFAARVALYEKKQPYRDVPVAK